MKLNELVSVCECECIQKGETEIKGISTDSRKVSKGDVFVAKCGTVTDGINYINDAVSKGAVAVISETPVGVSENTAYARVKNLNLTLGKAISHFYGNPTKKIKLVGVTGTSGKTTVTNIIYSIYSYLGVKSGLIGTILNKIGNRKVNANYTTPDPAELQKLFYEMAEENVSMCAMEVSSHALDQGRVSGCEFDCGVFLNIARDHLDYHKTIENYREAKLKLFSYYPKQQKKNFTAIVNRDENILEDVQKVFDGKILTFGRNSLADIYSSDEKISADKVEFDLNYKGEKVHTVFGMGGDFNVSNALAAAAVAVNDGISLSDIRKGIEATAPVNGRFQSVDCGQNFSVIVDYAHTPDEIEKLLISAGKIRKQKIITVFGCGGNRDRGKRPIMGKIACSNSDYVFITSDNPRNEEPIDIINDILPGIEQYKNYQVVCDRREAIREALKFAGKDDLVVIAGKGHEDYQIVKGVKYHFDDKEEIRNFLTQQ